MHAGADARTDATPAPDAGAAGSAVDSRLSRPGRRPGAPAGARCVTDGHGWKQLFATPAN